MSDWKVGESKVESPLSPLEAPDHSHCARPWASLWDRAFQRCVLRLAAGFFFILICLVRFDSLRRALSVARASGDFRRTGAIGLCGKPRVQRSGQGKSPLPFPLHGNYTTVVQNADHSIKRC